MQLSYRYKPHNKVDYFPLPNGYVDVFLHRNEKTEADEEGNVQYVAEEIYFQVEQSVTKEQIEDNFEFMWEDAEKEVAEEPSEIEALKERITTQDQVIEELMFIIIPELLGGGI